MPSKLGSVLTHTDPIFSFLKTQEWVLRRPGKINDEVRLTDADKNFSGVWVDAIDLDDFFSQDYSKKLIITNNIVKCSDDQALHIHTINPTWYGVYYYNYSYSSTDIQKDFNCLSNRYDIFRQSWFYQLIRRKLFNRGYISFNTDTEGKNRGTGPEFNGLLPVQVFELGFQKFNSIFAAEHEIIKNQIPYKNFNDTGDLTDIVLASKFSIILETFFHDNRIITYSEKIFRCLQLPRPWVLFSSQYAVDNLRKLGFDILDDVVDHYKYDEIADPVQRQIAVLDLCDQLVTLDMPSIANRCYSAAEHNKSLLKSMRDMWLINILEDFNQAKKKLLTL